MYTPRSQINVLRMRVVVSVLLLTLLLKLSEAIGCPDGTYGPTCVLKCGATCLQSRCVAVPSNGTFRCTQGCVEGWTGSTCERKCPRGCRSCDVTSGDCSDCNSGWCGTRCDEICTAPVPLRPNCKDSTCSECVPGWRGEECSEPCPQHCESGCNRTTGECDHQCVRGHHGPYCRALCTITCNEGCRQSDGVCLGGCEIGWFGSHCDKSCNRTCAGVTCYQNGECASTSNKLDWRLFEPRCKPVLKDRGLVRDCKEGCENGWRGERCDQVCPKDCYSCSRFPNAELCVYTLDVLYVKTYGVGGKTGNDGGFQFRLVYAMLLVIPPFLIVALMQLLRIGYRRYKQWRDLKKRVYIVNQDERNTQEKMFSEL